jgi:hypothetical protein
MWKGWGRNTGERREDDKDTKRLKESKKEGKGLRYEINNFPLNFNDLTPIRYITRKVIYVYHCC